MEHMDDIDQGISLNELFSILWKGKFIIILISIIALAITIGGSAYVKSSKSQVSTIVSMQWDGIDEGKYPNGTVFNYKNAISLGNIAKALEENYLNLNESTVKNAISIEPIIPSSIASAIEKAIKDGESLSYYATNYKIIIDNGVLGISVNEARDLLSDILINYRNEFVQKYIQRSLISNLINIDLSSLEYVDAYIILKNQIDLITSNLTEKLEYARNFISNETGLGFNDLIIRANLLTETKLNQIESRINTYYLVKDRDYLINKYSYELELKELDLAKLQAQETNLQTLIDNYEGNTQTIIIPGMDPSQAIEIDTYYDKLLDQLINKQHEIVEMENEISYLNILINRFSGQDPNNVIPEEVQVQQAIKVENEINNLNPILMNMIDEANELIVEYNSISSSSIVKPLMLPAYESNVNMLLNCAIGLFVGLGFGVVFVLLKKNWNNTQKS